MSFTMSWDATATVQFWLEFTDTIELPYSGFSIPGGCGDRLYDLPDQYLTPSGVPSFVVFTPASKWIGIYTTTISDIGTYTLRFSAQ